MENQPNRVLVTGPSGSGKTTLTRNRLLPALRSKYPDIYILVADPHGYYECQTRFHSGSRNEPPVYPWEWDWLDSPPDTYCFSFKNPLDWDTFFHFVEKFAQYNQVALVVDELAEFTSSHKTQDSFKWFLLYGRQYGMELIYCTQRPCGISMDLLTNVHEIYCFRDGFRPNIDALKRISFLGEGAEQVPGLKRYEWLNYSEDEPYGMGAEAENVVEKEAERGKETEEDDGDGFDRAGDTAGQHRGTDADRSDGEIKGRRGKSKKDVLVKRGADVGLPLPAEHPGAETGGGRTEDS